MRFAWNPGPFVARYLYARETGQFGRLGVEMQHLKFLSGPAVFAGLRSGSIDAAVFADTPTVVVLSQGVPLKIVFPENDNSRTQGLVAGKGSGIKQLADLRGKRIAIVLGSSGDYALELILRSVKMTRSDVQVINLDVTNLIPAFKKGEIDAAIYWEPWMSHLIDAGGDLITTNRAANIPLVGVMMVRSEWLEQNRLTMVGFLRAWDSVTEVIRARPEVIAGKVASESALDAERTLKLINKIDFLTLKDILDPQHPYSIARSSVAAGEGFTMHLSKLAQFMRSTGRIESVPDFKAAIDPSVAEDAARGG